MIPLAGMKGASAPSSSQKEKTMTPPTAPLPPSNCTNLRSGLDCIDRDLEPIAWCPFCTSYAFASSSASLFATEAYKQ